jgi:hypothetical protein
VLRVPGDALEGWTPPPPAAYRGAGDLRHGLRWPGEHPPLNEAVPVDA